MYLYLMIKFMAFYSLTVFREPKICSDEKKKGPQKAVKSEFHEHTWYL